MHKPYLTLLFLALVSCWVKDDVDYSIEFSFGKVSEEATSTFIDGKNNTFHCILPDTPEINEQELIVTDIPELLYPLHNLTLNLITGGYYSYQLRPARVALQFHAEVDKPVPIKNVDAYLLGASSTVRGELDSAEPAVILASDIQPTGPISGQFVNDEDEPYYVEYFSEGTPCRNMIRSSEVRYKCGYNNQDALALLENVTEDSTCHYILTVRTPLLCKHKDFFREKPFAKIRCSTQNLESLFGGKIKVSEGSSIKIRN
ncbi:hypothetical protein P9112_014573 [Eukaryota sp. TZLM1-RC]